MAEQSAQYTVLARRYRPQTFAEVVGQQNVAQALQNAIAKGKVAHAYLFTGARGVGKTSMARILAKSLNCPNAVDNVPCNDCDICDGVSAGNDVDVLEIDGASNRGIDDIRSLRANVAVKSMRSPHKIYIIDEVHMLTKEAFNALLKTLEEPPPNVKFIFCTTEPNKLPDTILSRCQRFDFSTIETASIAGRLQQIAESEGVEVDPAAVELVARRAAGSMRDSQSLFDQLLSFGGERISPEDVHQLLGTADDDRLIALAEALVAGRRDAVLELFDRALAEGVQLGELIDQLLGYLRDLMVIAAGAGQVELVSVSDASRVKLAEQASDWGLQTIVAAMQILAEAKGRISRASYGRSLAELALIRISLLEDLESVDRLIQTLKTGADLPQAATKRMPAATTPPSGNAGPSQKKTPEPAPVAPVIDAPPQISVSQVEFVEGKEQEFWTKVLGIIKDVSKRHAEAASRVAISAPNRLDLFFPKSYHFSRQYCEKPEVLARLERIAGEVAGRNIKIHLETVETAAEREEASKSEAPAERVSRRLPDAKDDPFVQQALTVFGGTLVKVDSISTRSSETEG